MRNTALFFALTSVLAACGSQAGDGLDLSSVPAPSASASAPAPSASSTASATPPFASAPPSSSSSPPSSPSDAGTKPTTPPTTPPAPSLPLIALQVHLNASTGDWLVSRVRGEGAPAYQFMGVNYVVLDAPLANTEPLYRCIDSAGTHYQSNRLDCEGVGQNEGLLGYTYKTDPNNGAKVVSRCIGPAGHPIVSTLRISDCDQFILQGVELGYAFTP